MLVFGCLRSQWLKGQCCGSFYFLLRQSVRQPCLKVQCILIVKNLLWDCTESSPRLYGISSRIVWHLLQYCAVSPPGLYCTVSPPVLCCISSRIVLYLLQYCTVSPPGLYCISFRIVLYLLQDCTASPPGLYCTVSPPWIVPYLLMVCEVNILQDITVLYSISYSFTQMKVKFVLLYTSQGSGWCMRACMC